MRKVSFLAIESHRAWQTTPSNQGRSFRSPQFHSGVKRLHSIENFRWAVARTLCDRTQQGRCVDADLLRARHAHRPHFESYSQCWKLNDSDNRAHRRRKPVTRCTSCSSFGIVAVDTGWNLNKRRRIKMSKFIAASTNVDTKSWCHHMSLERLFHLIISSRRPSSE